MRKVIGFVAAVAALAAMLVVAPSGGTPSAQALSDGLSFTVDDLPTWQTNGVVWAVQAVGGVVFAGGTFSQVSPPAGASGAPLAVSALVAFDAATGAPTSCQIPVTYAGATPTVRALKLAPDGRTLYIGGDFSNVGGFTVGRLAAVDVPTCTVKTSFHPSAVSSVVRT